MRVAIFMMLLTLPTTVSAASYGTPFTCQEVAKGYDPREVIGAFQGEFLGDAILVLSEGYCDLKPTAKPDIFDANCQAEGIEWTEAISIRRDASQATITLEDVGTFTLRRCDTPLS